MSLATFKKKSIHKHSSATKISGKPPGGFFLSQGPFGNNTNIYNIYNSSNVGFSLEGSQRNISVGKDMKFSKQGTRYKGIYPYGHGGKYGNYVQAEPVLNAENGIKGNQWQFIKPSVLSTRGMLRKKYRWAYTGQYPNYWVQPNYTGNLTNSASQGIYIHSKSAQNICVVDVNSVEKYEDNNKKVINCGPYTKNLYKPQDSSQQTLRIQKSCANPTAEQKPFPYRKYGGTGILRGGTSVSNVGTGCNTSLNFLR
jgi:hypothetical protein